MRRASGNPVRLTRRLFGGALGAWLGGRSVVSAARTGASDEGDRSRTAGPDRRSPATLFDPSYQRVPLRRDSIEIGVLQTPDVAIDHARAEFERRAAAQRMVELLDKTRSELSGRRLDLVCFHEMPLHGFGEWNRAQALRIAAEVPGVETELIGAKARELGCYVSFGSYVRDRDWPDHVIMMGVLIGPDGQVAARHWKARGTLGGLGLFTSTVYECYERYVEMYGEDAVIPVARTDIGNICLSGVQNDPLLFTTMALKGAELLLRFATGGMPDLDARQTSRTCGVYSAYANSSREPHHRFYAGGVGEGGSMIVGPGGEVLTRADAFQQLVTATLPISTFRQRRRVPDLPWPLYAPVFAQYRPRYAPSAFLKYLPSSWTDTRRYFSDKGQW
jgi:predicted amidohydrolase